MKILVTGFEPFGGSKTNSSMKILEELDIEYKKLLPVSYFRAKEELLAEIERISPDFVISLGQAGGADKIRIEKVGINYQWATIPDNDGVSNNNKIEDNGPDGIFTNADVLHIVDELKKDNIPATLSLSAGAYICNTVYYTALAKMKGNALFIHLPYLEGESTKAMPTKEMVNAVSKVIMHIEEQFKKE